MGRLRARRSGDTTEEPTIVERTGGPIGSGSVTTVVQSDGDATQHLTGRSGPSKDDVTQSKSDLVSVTTPTLGNNTLESRTREVEQTAETATAGRAFGDDSVENIGGEGNPAVTTVSGGGKDAQNAQSGEQSRQGALKVAAAGAALIAGAALLSGGEQ